MTVTPKNEENKTMGEKTIEQKLVQAVKAKSGIGAEVRVARDFPGFPTALSYCRMGNAASWKSRSLVGNHGRCRSQGYGYCGGWVLVFVLDDEIQIPHILSEIGGDSGGV